MRMAGLSSRWLAVSLAPLPRRALLIRPRQFADVPSRPRHGAPAEIAGVVDEVLARQADVVPADDLGVGSYRHAGGDVPDGGAGKVAHFGKERRGVVAGEVWSRLHEIHPANPYRVGVA